MARDLYRSFKIWMPLGHLSQHFFKLELDAEFDLRILAGNMDWPFYIFIPHSLTEALRLVSRGWCRCCKHVCFLKDDPIFRQGIWLVQAARGTQLICTRCVDDSHVCGLISVCTQMLTFDDLVTFLSVVTFGERLGDDSSTFCGWSVLSHNILAEVPLKKRWNLLLG